MVLLERMFGTRERFDYYECDSCGTIGIGAIPADMGPFYPDGYYSFGGGISWKRRARLRFAALARRLGNRSFSRGLGVDEVLQWLPLRGRILDVGSGSGVLLQSLRCFCYNKCYGVDPFIPEDTTAHGVVLWKRELPDVEGLFDAIMMHHSLEHVPSPDEVFAELSRLLVEGGVLIVRVPVVPNAIYDEFGIDWPQLDAPRHIHTFTVKALGLLAAKHGFSIVNIAYDSGQWSLAVARSYALGVALVDIPDSEKRGTPQDAAQVARWNDEERGDQVRMVLTRRATVASASGPQDETPQDSRTAAQQWLPADAASLVSRDVVYEKVESRAAGADGCEQ